MFVITGATGHTGSVAAKSLLAAGKQVRVIVRDAEKAAPLKALGAEVLVAGLDDTAALGRAAEGAEGVFLLSPPDFTPTDFITERKQLTQRQVDALAAVGARHVVLLSSIGAQLPAGTGPIVTLHNAEQQLRAAGLAATFVRAAYFVENWGAVVPAVTGDGVLPSFIAATQRIPMVSTHDIGTTVAQALRDGPRGTRVIELAGPNDVSAEDLAEAFARILGKPVKVVEAPLEAVMPTFQSFGASENMARLSQEMYAAIAQGKLVPEAGEHLRGSTPLESTLRALVGG